MSLKNQTEDKSSDVQQRILDAAQDLFVKNGFKGTSIRDIAIRSDVNVAMINYYFGSKSNLFEIIFENIFAMFAERMSPIINSPLPFFELVEEWINSYFEILVQHPLIPIFLLNEIEQNREQLIFKIKRKGTYDIYMKFKKRIELEIDNGLIKAIPPTSVLLNILSLCLFPFVFGKLVLAFNNVNSSEYYTMLDIHKKFIVQSVIDTLKKD